MCVYLSRSSSASGQKNNLHAERHTHTHTLQDTHTQTNRHRLFGLSLRLQVSWPSPPEYNYYVRHQNFADSSKAPPPPTPIIHNPLIILNQPILTCVLGWASARKLSGENINLINMQRERERERKRFVEFICHFETNTCTTLTLSWALHK